ncbi:u3 small nucleolar ribonucleoprotein mpp10 [Anaeramoeba flamelloides]|uniref:U3 small nucleolar ribonucleoprotein mpp10 n=1 Tax=Anaeramoeba flamelloides TaxID=1746091 RepID=A0ABQ8YGX5_9EUKA|nr:u3 small nucleolar ribonucleoprotein mpp10 [Anaeramoeba flamelloides]
MHKRSRTFTQTGSIQDAKFATSGPTTPTARTPLPNKQQNIPTITEYMMLIDNQTNPELFNRNYENQSNQICNMNIPLIDYTGLQSQNHKQEKEQEETEQNSSERNGGYDKNGFVSFLFNIQSKKDKKKKKKKKEIGNYKNKKIHKVRDLKQKWNQKITKPNQKNNFELTPRKRDLPNNNWESSLIDEQKYFSGVNLLCYDNKITSTVKRRRKNLNSTKPLSHDKKKNKKKNKKKQRKKKLRKKKKRRKKKKNTKNLKKEKTHQSKRIQVISRIGSSSQGSISPMRPNKPDQKTVRLEKKLGSLACENNDLQSKVQGYKMEKLRLKNELIQLQLLLRQKKILDSLSQTKNASSITVTKPTITKKETAFQPLERKRITTKNNINSKDALPTSKTPLLSSNTSSLSSLSSSLSSSSLSYSCSGTMSGSGSGSSSQIETPTSEPLINYELEGTKFIIDNSEEEDEEDLGLSKFHNKNTIEKENATAESEEETCFYWQSLQRKNSKLKRYVDEEYPVLIEQVLHNKVQISRRADRLKAKLTILRWLCNLDLYLRIMGEEGLDWNEILYGSSHKREFLRFVHRTQEKVKLNEGLALQIYEHDIAISKNLLSNDMIVDSVKAQIQELNLNENLFSYLNSGLLHSRNHYNQLPKSEDNAFQIITRSDSESEQTEDSQENEHLEEDEDVEIFETNVDEEDFDDAVGSDNIEEDIDQNVDASLSVSLGVDVDVDEDEDVDADEDVDVDVNGDINEENEKKDIINKKNLNLEPENSICDPQIESATIQDFGILINDQDNRCTKDLNSNLIENNNQNQNLKKNNDISSLTFLEKMN